MKQETVDYIYPIFRYTFEVLDAIGRREADGREQVQAKFMRLLNSFYREGELKHFPDGRDPGAPPHSEHCLIHAAMVFWVDEMLIGPMSPPSNPEPVSDEELATDDFGRALPKVKPPAEWHKEWMNDTLENHYWKRRVKAVHFYELAEEATKLPGADASEVFCLCRRMGFIGNAKDCLELTRRLEIAEQRTVDAAQEARERAESATARAATGDPPRLWSRLPGWFLAAGLVSGVFCLLLSVAVAVLHWLQ